MRISDWSSDVCSSDLEAGGVDAAGCQLPGPVVAAIGGGCEGHGGAGPAERLCAGETDSSGQIGFASFRARFFHSVYISFFSFSFHHYSSSFFLLFFFSFFSLFFPHSFFFFFFF